MKTTTSIIQDTRKLKKNGKYPIKLRVTHNRISRFFNVNVDLSQEEFEKVMKQNPRAEFKEIKMKLLIIEQKAQNIINELIYFNFEEFRDLFYSKVDYKNVYSVWSKYIEDLNKEGRITTASSYECGLKAFKKFKANLSFHQVTPELLNRFEKWMLDNGKSISTVGIYTRCIRTIFNLVREQLKGVKYPFSRNGYCIPASRNIKKALKFEQIKQIFDYEVEEDGTFKAAALDFWIFSYLSNGMNVKDILSLKWRDLDSNQITYVRQKTIRSKKMNQKPIQVFLSDHLKAIIARRSNTDRTPESYLFPFLNDRMTGEEKLRKIKKATREVNKWMNIIGEELEIELNLTTYVARHSFSTVLKRSGAPMEFINESLGHSSMRTTERYLDSFEDEAREKYANFLIPK